MHLSLLLIMLSAPDIAVLEQQINELIAGQPTVYGIAFQRSDTGQKLEINSGDQMHAASTMKVPVMMRIFEMIEAGELTLETRIPVRNAFKSIIDGSTYSIEVDQGQELYQRLGKDESVERLLYWMIAHSSNLATNLLIDLADAGKTRAMLKKLNITGVLVLRGVEDIKAYEAGKSNRATAGGMLQTMIAMAESDHFTPQSRQKMMAILRQQHYTEMIPAGIPKDAGAIIANKTGSISTVEHDAAIIDLPNGRRFALVIFTRDFPGEKGRNQAKQTATKISRLIYDYMTQSPQ